MTKTDDHDKIRERVLSLIESEFNSDADFEREMGLAPKTVNNWRRHRSASYMKILPHICDRFGVNIGELFNMPLRADTSELSDDEMQLLSLYRSARTLPEGMRQALRRTLQTTIELYILTASEKKRTRKK